MGKLHQLLAVKKDTAKRANEIAGETVKALGSKHLFYGSIRSYRPFDEEDKTKIPDEHEQMSYTVGEKLDWFAKEFGRYIDVEYQIDLANEGATADLKVGDFENSFEILDVPAPFLLDLTAFLTTIRKVYVSMPVLDPKYQWEDHPDAGPGVHKVADAEHTFRSKKMLSHKVLYEATPEHPAQVEKWTEDVQVGEYTKNSWSGAVTAVQKAEIMSRIDKLLLAAKRALSAANDAEHGSGRVAARIFGYIHGDLPIEGIYREEEE